MGHNQPPEGNLSDTTCRWEETCRTQPAALRKPAGHNHPPEGNLPDTTSHRKKTCRTQPAAGRKTAGHKQPPEGNLPDTNSQTPQCLRHLLLHGHSHTFSAGLPGQVTVSPQNCSILTRSMRWPPGYPK